MAQNEAQDLAKIKSGIQSEIREIEELTVYDLTEKEQKEYLKQIGCEGKILTCPPRKKYPAEKEFMEDLQMWTRLSQQAIQL